VVVSQDPTVPDALNERLEILEYRQNLDRLCFDGLRYTISGQRPRGHRQGLEGLRADPAPEQLRELHALNMSV